MKTLCYAVFMIFMIKIASFAPIAKGQEQTTQTVVNPSVLPYDLPIGSRSKMLDWIVTNPQWHMNGKPLFVYTDFLIDYEKKGGFKNYRYFNFRDRKFKSFKDYRDQMTEYGLKLLQSLATEADLDPEIPLVLTSLHTYQNQETQVGIGGMYMEKYLGYIGEIKPEDFNYPEPKIVAMQSVVRISDLKEFDMYVETDEVNYTYSWPSKKVQPASVFPVELTTSDFIVLASWYSEGQYKARFKITAGGQTAEYTQHGTRIEPPKLSITGSGVEVSFTHGSKTTIQESPDLVSWKTIKTIPWDFGTNSVSINYGSESSSSLSKTKKFFRAVSE